MKLYIDTLGRFDIGDDKKSHLSETARTYRLFKLFQYFITFKNRKILAETIMDHLLTDSETDDPKNVLRTQIFRLRQLLKKMESHHDDQGAHLNVVFTNGNYCLEIGPSVQVDVDRFQHLIQQGDNRKPDELRKAADDYLAALSLYKGTYLAENPYEVWLVPIRNYYQRLYIKTIDKTVDILNELEAYDEIISLCEKALEIEPYEESIHLHLMRGMLRSGKSKSALWHYEYTEQLLKKELGVEPSPIMKEMLRKIQSHFIEKVNLDIPIMDEKFVEGPDTGALKCDDEMFKFLYNIHKRQSQRDKEKDYICLITLKSPENFPQEQKQMQHWMTDMEVVLSESLRKGDVFTFWNDTQILLLLHRVKETGLKTLESRIKRNLFETNRKRYMEIKMQFHPITDSQHIMSGTSAR